MCFLGKGNLVQHFDNVAILNGWDEVQKTLWLHVRLTGKAHVALTRIKATGYKHTIEALRERFEPSVTKNLYKAELHSRERQEGESWGDFADALSVLADKAYPD